MEDADAEETSSPATLPTVLMGQINVNFEGIAVRGESPIQIQNPLVPITTETSTSAWEGLHSEVPSGDGFVSAEGSVLHNSSFHVVTEQQKFPALEPHVTGQQEFPTFQIHNQLLPTDTRIFPELMIPTVGQLLPT